MAPPPHPDGVPPEDQTSSPFQKRWRRRSARVTNFQLRDLWWRLLDALESRHTLRRMLYAAGAALVLIGAAWAWAYPWWMRRNALSIARQWMAAGRLDYAAETVRQALADSPDRPEVWRLAAELARRSRKPAEAADYSRHAASLAPENTGFALDWAEDALLAEQPDAADKALAGLPAAVLASSSHAQRIAGEIARRRFLLTLAQSHFEAALRIDGPVAIDEVPLGSILIYARDPAQRQRGLGLLTKWTSDPEWGAAALRPLLGDALDHDDRPAMLKWAETLRAHPRCTLADIPNCLLAISRADGARFATVLGILEKGAAVSPAQAAQLIGWLNQIGRSAEAVGWLQTLPPDVTKKAPVVVVAAEALRRTSSWDSLSALVGADDWGRDVAFIRLAYGLEAARQLRDQPRADEFWRTLQSDAQTSAAHALFAGDTLYAWGRTDEALTLLWLAADKPGVALDALGTLARHYQVQRDANGQYRVFRRLHALRSQDDSIANNFAFFAALTANDFSSAEAIARENHARAPTSAAYLATYAFILTAENRPAEALALLKPVADEWQKSSGVAFAYGLALAGAGRKAEGRPILESIDASALTLREAELIASALN